MLNKCLSQQALCVSRSKASKRVRIGREKNMRGEKKRRESRKKILL